MNGGVTGSGLYFYTERHEYFSTILHFKSTDLFTHVSLTTPLRSYFSSHYNRSAFNKGVGATREINYLPLPLQNFVELRMKKKSILHIVHFKLCLILTRSSIYIFFFSLIPVVGYWLQYCGQYFKGSGTPSVPQPFLSLIQLSLLTFSLLACSHTHTHVLTYSIYIMI